MQIAEKAAMIFPLKKTGVFTKQKNYTAELMLAPPEGTPIYPSFLTSSASVSDFSSESLFSSSETNSS